MGFIITNYNDRHDKTNEAAYARPEVYKIDHVRNTLQIWMWTYSSTKARMEGATPIIIQRYNFPLDILGDCISLNHIYKLLNHHEDWHKENIRWVEERMISESDKYAKGKHISLDIASKEGFKEGIDYEVVSVENEGEERRFSFDVDGNILYLG